MTRKTGTWTITDDVQETYTILRRHAFERDGPQDALRFLHGHCAVFALALHALRGYPLAMRLEAPSGPEAGCPLDRLAHMYCEVPSRSDALLADVRGITDDEDAFLAPFTEPGPTDRPPAKAPAPSPEKVRTHLAGRMGEENYAAWYAEALLFIAARPGWWPGTAPAASRKERPLPHVRIRPDDNLTRTKG